MFAWLYWKTYTIFHKVAWQFSPQYFWEPINKLRMFAWLYWKTYSISHKVAWQFSPQYFWEPINKYF